MIARITINDLQAIEVDLNQPIDISIPIKEGSNNPNCYWAEPVKFETIRSDGFVGSVAEGGSVNYQKLTITPHGNGTHIECYGHISNSGATIFSQLKSYHFYAKLSTLSPEKVANGDQVIKLTPEIEKENWNDVKALIIRTTPNNENKRTRSYSGKNPAYLSEELIRFIVKKGIEHLLIDLPSLDKEVDGGALMAHKAFWGFPNGIRKYATVTELIFVRNDIPDANYLLNLQTIGLEMDAAPCKPTLYSIQKLITLNS